MEVFKFGGASIKDADAVVNLLNVLEANPTKKLAIVVSAMGKTTNALETIIQRKLNGEDVEENLNTLRDFHTNITQRLVMNKNHPLHHTITFLFIELEDALKNYKKYNYDKFYDSVVCFGEILSSTIISHFLNLNGHANQWVDARKWLITNGNHRMAAVNWEETLDNCDILVRPFLDERTILTQGFISGTIKGVPTTLGREGSDYTAAILASCLGAKKVTIWKDVDGVQNADPKLFSDTVKFSHLPYGEAIEMAYYGASIIHPKTLQPLKQKNIPLYVRPFSNPESTGTAISAEQTDIQKTPVIIVKDQQMLLSIGSNDGAFMSETGLSEVFACFGKRDVKLNMIQLSALSFSVCFNQNAPHVNEILDEIKDKFKVKYNHDLRLITLRHYNEALILEMLKGRKPLMEQRTRTTIQFVIPQD